MMSFEQSIEAGMAAFKEKVEELCLEAFEGPLTADAAHAVSLGLRNALSAAGAAAFRSYLESKDEQRGLVVRDGEVYRYKFDVEKTFIGFWGRTPVTRRLYQNAADTKTYVPLDGAWDMEEEFFMAEVREAVAFSCAHLTPEETEGLLRTCALFQPHATQIKKAVKRFGGDIAERREELDARIRQEEQAPEETRVLAASLDGANVALRREQSEDAGAGEAEAKKSCYKNAMVGSVSFYGEAPPDEKTPERLASRYVTHMPEERAPAFKGRFEAELDAAEALAPGAIKVLICDGARPLWNYIDAVERYDAYEKIIDFWHAAEHLSLAADALFGTGSEQAKQWFATYRRKLLEEDDGAERVLNSIDYYRKNSPRPAHRAKALLKQRTFFTNNKRRMTYAHFRRRGLPIGSGPVEAACKSLVKTRLCRSGMRWSIEGGQAILDLRTYVKSGRWEALCRHLKELKHSKKAA
jgi:hypothetical protein